jgi:hypothetical protein
MPDEKQTPRARRQRAEAPPPPPDEPGAADADGETAEAPPDTAELERLRARLIQQFRRRR